MPTDIFSIEGLDRLINNLNLQILNHGVLTTDRDWNYPAVVSPFNRLFYILEGRAGIISNGKKIILNKNHICLIPAETQNTYFCPDSLTMVFFHFHYKVFGFTDLFSKREKLFIKKACSQNSNSLADYFNPKNRKCHKRELTNRAIITLEGVLRQQLCSFFDEKTEMRIKNASTIQVKNITLLKFIQEHLSAQLKVSDLAEYCLMTCNGFSKYFIREFNQPVKTFLNNGLFLRSREALLLTDKKVKHIAEELGFRDEFYFSRFFKKMSGLPPLVYKKNQLCLLKKQETRAKK